MKRMLTPLRLALAGLALLVVAGLILWLTPSGKYILLPDKARPVGPLVSVPRTHAKKAKGDGRIYFLAVVVRKATLLENLFPWMRDGATLVPASALRPPGVSDAEEQQIDRHDMSQSQEIAAAVALRTLGYKVTTHQVGAQILEVDPVVCHKRMPAAGKLKPTDVITALDGRPVKSRRDLQRLMAKQHPGELVRFTVRSAGGLRKVRLRPVANPCEGGRPMIGVILDQAAEIHLPFPIRINAGSVVGPSAGLAFALEIMQRLGRDAVHGQSVAATGELELDGTVLPIGGVEQKAIEAKRAHVDILLVPAGENAAEARRYAGSVKVVPVKTFQQALRELATAARTA
jgi:Lon-like protease